MKLIAQFSSCSTWPARSRLHHDSGAAEPFIPKLVWFYSPSLRLRPWRNFSVIHGTVLAAIRPCSAKNIVFCCEQPAMRHVRSDTPSCRRSGVKTPLPPWLTGSDWGLFEFAWGHGDLIGHVCERVRECWKLFAHLRVPDASQTSRQLGFLQLTPLKARNSPRAPSAQCWTVLVWRRDHMFVSCFQPRASPKCWVQLKHLLVHLCFAKLFFLLLFKLIRSGIRERIKNGNDWHFRLHLLYRIFI